MKSERAQQRHTQSFQNFYDMNDCNFAFGVYTGKSQKQIHYDSVIKRAERLKSERKDSFIQSQEELDCKVKEFEKSKIKQHMKRLRQKEISYRKEIKKLDELRMHDIFEKRQQKELSVELKLRKYSNSNSSTKRSRYRDEVKENSHMIEKSKIMHYVDQINKKQRKFNRCIENLQKINDEKIRINLLIAKKKQRNLKYQEMSAEQERQEKLEKIMKN